MRGSSVLVVSHGSDDHVPLVCAELAKLGVETVIYDTDRYGVEVDASLIIEGHEPSCIFRVGETEHFGDRFAAILFRHIRFPKAPQIADLAARRMAESELRATLEGTILALEPALWMNHPHANRLARNKLLQLRLAAKRGFKVPDTLVSSDPREIRKQYRAWNGRIIAKLTGGQIAAESIESQYLILTTQLSESDLHDDAALSACPAIYQRLVEKQYEVRVTVVGDEVFACRIDSQALDIARIDWRAAGYTALSNQPYNLDAATSDRCRALMRHLDLEIAGFDFIVTPEGEMVFLEINAAGQWAWVQETTGLPIAAAVARRLAAATRTDASFNTRAP